MMKDDDWLKPGIKDDDWLEHAMKDDDWLEHGMKDADWLEYVMKVADWGELDKRTSVSFTSELLRFCRFVKKYSEARVTTFAMLHNCQRMDILYNVYHHHILPCYP